jgi:hypothetical protein
MSCLRLVPVERDLLYLVSIYQVCYMRFQRLSNEYMHGPTMLALDGNLVGVSDSSNNRHLSF